jgi:hypothetical protein
MRTVVSHHLTLVPAFENKGELIIATAYQKVFALGIGLERVRGVGTGFDDLMSSYR